MTVLNPAPVLAGTVHRAEGNDADLRYLEETRAALQQMISISAAVSGRAAGHDVRALAREALSVQTAQLEAISVCLLAWHRQGAAGPRTARTEALPGLHGPMLDLAFAEQLTAHARTSMTAARAELVAGVSRRARTIAEDAIRAQSRQLAALDLLPAPATGQR